MSNMNMEYRVIVNPDPNNYHLGSGHYVKADSIMDAGRKFPGTVAVTAFRNPDGTLVHPERNPAHEDYTLVIN